MQRNIPVHINVHNEMAQGNEKEKFEFYTTGQYYTKDKYIYLSYLEEQDFGQIKTLLKISDEEVLLIRSGAINMRQRFKENVETVTNYETPYGMMRLVTHTKSLLWSSYEEPKRGTLKLEYHLDIGQEQHVHRLTIEYKEEQ
ncbi:DUF1934 domain-containing protein [Bacillus alveayuensis]|jgi:uncharacterized beta-barrel protein YwiB (DUF1934 family)|uniref:Uncharacterized beta-barrel protein YwiB (DUF1934 family) n=1 Tax=Aeribacillus alveayuensis TaxID=279215 RepID=A0ABT9VP26_9BACI|nr:DUF1934 domain-containing protein [Bacillus alveayuensis]MDQ0162649.1 uncharacterized beta-barrel protein YwiB (DUF1934 family) [Bacillus alveayuensis]